MSAVWLESGSFKGVTDKAVCASLRVEDGGMDGRNECMDEIKGWKRYIGRKEGWMKR